MVSTLLDILPLLFWSGLWTAAGFLIATFVFRVPKRERTMIGLALGLVMQTWLGNLLAQILPPDPAFWAGAVLPLLFGLMAAWPLRGENLKQAISISIPQSLGFLFLVWIYFGINRGLNLLDDFQNLPLVSVIAAGDVPPHFPLDPNVEFGYHYQLLLFGGQISRLGHLFPWTAFDLARAFAIALSFFLMYLFVWRMTRNSIVGLLGGAFALLASGARWLFLLMPATAVQAVSSQIGLIGSARQIAPDLYSALALPWNVDGSGPIPFPFAFLNGFINPRTMALSGPGALSLVTIMLLILLYRRQHDWRGGAVMVVLLASLGFIAEYEYAVLIPAFALALLIHCLLKRSFYWPKSLNTWLVILFISSLFVFVQGGVLTQLAQGWLPQPGGNAPETAYHSFHFSLVWPPSFISAHLGVLKLSNPAQLLALLFELGPLLLALPLTIAWGLKMARTERWFEAAIIGWVMPGAMTSVIQYSGTAGVSANSRLVGLLLTPPLIYAVPLGWAWLKRRGQHWKLIATLLLVTSIFSGVMLFGIEIIAGQRALLPQWVNDLDARISRLYWDRLPAGSMVFDVVPTRSVIIFGRFVNSSVDWFSYKPEWDALVLAPDPVTVHAAGYDFAYLGSQEWEDLSPDLQAAWRSSCVKIVERVEGFRSATDFRKDFRLLLDIRGCQQR